MSDQDANAGSGAGGSSGTGEVDLSGFIRREDFEAALERQQRSFQSSLDRFKDGFSKAQPAPDPDAKPKDFDPSAAMAEMEARMARQWALNEERSQLKADFPDIDSDLLRANYETPEEMRRTVEQASKARADQLAALRTEAREAVLAEFKATGVDVDKIAPQVTPSDGEGGTKPPTVHDLASLPFSEFLQVDREVITGALDEA